MLLTHKFHNEIAMLIVDGDGSEWGETLREEWKIQTGAEEAGAKRRDIKM